MLFRDLLKVFSAVLLLAVSIPAQARSSGDLGVLRQYSEYFGVNQTCKGIGVDHSPKLQVFLQTKLSILKAMQADKSVPAARKTELAAAIQRLETGAPDLEVAKAATDKARKQRDLPEACSKFPQTLDALIDQDKLLLKLRATTPAFANN